MNNTETLDNVGYTKTQDEHKHNTKTQHNIEHLKDEQHRPYQIGKLVN
jgi:hypothetical protein